MTDFTEENLSYFNRSARIVIGLALVLSILFVPFQPSWIAIAAFLSFYPLLTALLSYDPLLRLTTAAIENVSATLHFKTSAST